MYNMLPHGENRGRDRPRLECRETMERTGEGTDQDWNVVIQCRNICGRSDDIGGHSEQNILEDTSGDWPLSLTGRRLTAEKTVGGADISLNVGDLENPNTI